MVLEVMDRKKASSTEARTKSLESLATREYCYLTTTGRVSGRPHEIEIWFGLEGSVLYLLSGGGDDSDWVKNLRADPSVKIRIARNNITGRARIVSDRTEDQRARRLLATKYQGWTGGRKMSAWARTALPVAIELESY